MLAAKTQAIIRRKNFLRKSPRSAPQKKGADLSAPLQLDIFPTVNELFVFYLIQIKSAAFRIGLNAGGPRESPADIGKILSP